MLAGAALASGAAAALIQLQGPALRPGMFSGSARLPLQRAAGGDTPVLSLASAGGPVRLLVDTGASSTLVSPDLVRRLRLPSRPIAAADFGLAGAGSGCGQLQPRRTALPALTLAAGRPAEAPPASLRLTGAEALVLPVAGLPPDVDGVLGAPQLRQLPLWVDPGGGPRGGSGGGELAFGPAALEASRRSGSGRRVTVVPLRWHRGVPLLSLATGGRVGTVPALADTGAEGLFVTAELAAVLPALEPPRPLRVAGFCGEQPATWARVRGPSLTGRQPPPPVQAILTTNPVFAALGVEAIVGQALLGSHRQLWRLDTSPPLLRLW